MSYQVAIPSRKRVSLLSETTIPTLLNGGVRPDQITVWVTAEEVEDYKPVAEQFGVAVRDHGNHAGMANARNGIIRQYDTGTKLVQVDDDIRAIKIKAGDGLQNLHSADELFRRSFELLDANALSLWGVYAVANAFYMSDRSRIGLNFCVGALFGMIVRSEPWEMASVDEKEDVERSLRAFTRDGASLRHDWVTLETKYYKQGGGMQADGTRTAEFIDASARKVCEQFPELATLWKRKSGRAEVRLKTLPAAYIPRLF